MNTLNNIKNIVVNAGKFHIVGSVFAGVIVGICLLGIVMPQATCADFANTANASYVAKATNTAQKVIGTLKVVVTAYSSTPDQTDDTPFTTASGKQVADGIMANNMLAFGTKIRIPKLFGDKVFVIQDRMNKRMGNQRFDIWFPDRTSAIKFGVQTADIEILES